MVNYISNTFNFVATTGHIPLNSLPCHDQICGVFRNGMYTSVRERTIKYNIDYFQGTKASCQCRRPKSPIVIILESPHIDEYCKHCGSPLGPAQGNTGKFFDEYFFKLIRKSNIYKNIRHGVHAVVFVNAVQYQCSLGNALSGAKNTANRAMRDQNWMKCMSNGCTADLIQRIDALSPYAIINLCTNGSQNLRSVVDGLIKQNFPSVYYTQGNHPSSWWCPNNRKIN